MCILVRHWKAIHTKIVQLVLDLWRESLRKPALIYVRTTKAQISTFAVRYSLLFPTKKRLANFNGEQNDTWNLIVSHRICHFRAVQPFDTKKMFSSKCGHPRLIQAVERGPLLSANKIIRFYRMCEWRAKAQMIFCRCADDVNPHILCILKGIILLDAAHLIASEYFPCWIN